MEADIGRSAHFSRCPRAETALRRTPPRIQHRLDHRRGTPAAPTPLPCRTPFQNRPLQGSRQPGAPVPRSTRRVHGRRRVRTRSRCPSTASAERASTGSTCRWGMRLCRVPPTRPARSSSGAGSRQVSGATTRRLRRQPLSPDGQGASAAYPSRVGPRCAGREGGRGETGAVAEEAAEVRGVGEAEMDGHRPGIPPGSSQQAAGFQEAPLVDEFTHPLPVASRAARLRVRTEQPSSSA